MKINRARFGYASLSHRYSACKAVITGLFLSIFIITLSAVTTCSAQVRLFLIGNSFSQNAGTFLPQLAKEGHHELIIGRAELGGCTLQTHWEIVMAAEADPNSEAGRRYDGKSLRTLLSEGTWDIVSIQQASILSGDSTTYEPYASKLYAFIKSIQPKAKVVFHETWSYREDDTVFGRINGNKVARTSAEMYANLKMSYQHMANKLQVRLIPDGDAFWTSYNDPKWAFKKDLSFDYKNPVYPALPVETNSLNKGYYYEDDKAFKFDSHHASTAGCYLAGLVWYGFLFNESPEKLKFKPEGISKAFARHLRTTARKVLQQEKLRTKN